MNQTNSIHELIFPKNIVDTWLKDGKYIAGKYGTTSYDIKLLEDTEVRNGIFVKPVHLKGRFKWTQPYLENEINSGTKISIRTIGLSPSYEKIEYEREVPPSLIDRNVGVTVNEIAQNYVDELFGTKQLFSNPKPVDLVSYLLNFKNNPNLTILDFFTGSATTAEAVMRLNMKDGGNRKYILCTLDEKVAEKSIAKAAGYETIDQISRERIRRSGEKIKLENPIIKETQDFGFRAYKLDDSNFKDITKRPGKLS